MPNLIHNQIWFLSQIVPSGCDSVLFRSAADDGAAQSVSNRLADTICETAHWSAKDRLDVYRNAYSIRLRDCLRDEFSVLRRTLGDETFDHFADEYIRVCPPSSYTLGRLGAKLPEFLKTTRPERTTSDGSPDWADFIAELADFEWTISEVFDGPGTENNRPEGERSPLDSKTASSELRFQFAPCLRLRAYQFPVHELYSLAREGAVCEFPTARPGYVAVTRQDYTVRHYDLSATEFQLLQELMLDRSLQEALESVCGDCEIRAAEVESHLQNWFARWTQRRFLTDVLAFEPAADADMPPKSEIKSGQSSADCMPLNCYCGDPPW